MGLTSYIKASVSWQRIGCAKAAVPWSGGHIPVPVSLSGGMTFWCSHPYSRSMWSLPYSSRARGPALQPAQALMFLLPETHLWPMNRMQLFSNSEGPPWSANAPCVGAMWPPQQCEFLPLGELLSVCRALLHAQPDLLKSSLEFLIATHLPTHAQMKVLLCVGKVRSTSHRYQQASRPMIALQRLFHLSVCHLLYSRSYLNNVKSSFLETFLPVALAPSISLAGGEPMQPGGLLVYFQLSRVLREEDMNIAEDDIANYYCSLTFLNC